MVENLKIPNGHICAAMFSTREEYVGTLPGLFNWWRRLSYEASPEGRLEALEAKVKQLESENFRMRCCTNCDNRLGAHCVQMEEGALKFQEIKYPRIPCAHWAKESFPEVAYVEVLEERILQPR